MNTLRKIFSMMAILATTLVLSGAQLYESTPSPNGWPMAGQNKQNTAFQSREHTISPSNVNQLQKLWIYNTDDNNVPINRVYPKSAVLSTPSVDKQNQTIYFGDLNGRLHAVNAKTGKAIWIKSIVNDYLQDIITQKNLDKSKVYVFTRNTPAIFGNSLIIGVRAGFVNGSLTGNVNFDTQVAIGGGIVMAVSRSDGHLLWRTNIAPKTAPLSSVSSGLTVFGNTIYGGTTLLAEEALDPTPTAQAEVTRIYQALNVPLPADGYKCCGAAGVTFALNASTGKLIYAVPTIDPSLPTGFGGWAGASPWAVSNPPVDLKRQTVYFSTGNLYNVATNAQQCLANAGTDMNARTLCMPSGVHQDSIMALDMKSGTIKWAKPYFRIDVGGAACIGNSFGAPGTGCNDPLAVGNPLYITQSFADADFGQSPMLTEVNGVQTMFISQKSGTVYSINPSNGVVNWQTSTGPGSLFGGSEFGSATDGIRIYNQNTNGAQLSLGPSGLVINLTPVTLVNEYSPTPTGPGGFFSALDVKTGQILWQTRDPNALTINPAYIIHASPFGAVTTANGVVYGTSVKNTLIAMSAATGQILWQNNTDVTGAGFAPPAIVNGVLYWPTGQVPVSIAPGSPTSPVDSADPYNPFDNKVIAFTLPSGTCNIDTDSAAEDDSLDINDQ